MTRWSIWCSTMASSCDHSGMGAGFHGALMATGHGLAARAGKLAQTEALRPSVDTPMCAGCGVCMEVCNFDAIRLEGGRATIDHELCTGCGQCFRACPAEARKARWIFMAQTLVLTHPAGNIENLHLALAEAQPVCL